MSSIKRLLDGHEPECGYSNNADWEGCICQILREAYRRGRKDAAKDTGAYVITNLDSKLETADFLDGLWNAAGGGEQE